jgi:hypothetical protein
MVSRVEWRGKTFDSRTRDMLAEVAKIVGDDIYVHPVQGSYNSGGVAASAGTHDAGGAVDLRTSNLSSSQKSRLLKAMRKVGFAAWLRTPDQGNWGPHCHGIAVQPGGKNDKGVLSSGAHSQVVAYYEGRNGLANHHHDDGPRDYVGVTWESYKHPESSQPTVRLSNLQYGDRNDDVKDLQRALNRHLSGADIAVDGYYGEQTDAAVRRCQRDHDLGEDAPRHSFVGPRQAQHLGLRVAS